MNLHQLVGMVNLFSTKNTMACPYMRFYVFV